MDGKETAEIVVPLSYVISAVAALTGALVSLFFINQKQSKAHVMKIESVYSSFLQRSDENAQKMQNVVSDNKLALERLTVAVEHLSDKIDQI